MKLSKTSRITLILALNTFKVFSRLHNNGKHHMDSQNIIADSGKSSRREGKIFSLFTVVQFKNGPCTSTSTLSTGSTNLRNGTCYASSECSQKGGSSQGSCASGFGVCCVFTFNSATNTINVNDSYLQNPGFPSAYSGTSQVSYTIQKCSNDICWLRLDFEQFTMLGTTDTIETTGGVCQDSFSVTTSTGQAIPTICGQNTGQHMYIDIGTVASDTATLNFNFGNAASTSRIWDIKVAQIPCGTNYAPPDGCLQWSSGLTGRISTWNFLDAAGTHQANLEYTHCVRRENGYCCIQYQACSDPNSFTLDSNANPGTALVDTDCTADYVNIATSTGNCVQAGDGTATFYSRYCGGVLSPTTGGKVNVPICDCTFPFEVAFHTDNTMDAVMDPVSRGVCLDYQQIPCN